MEKLRAFLTEWYNDEPTVNARTSGSTGQPKDIRLRKNDMLVSAHNTNSFFGIDSHSVLGLPLSIDYIAGKMMVVRSLAASCRLRQFPVSNSIFVDEPIDLLSVVPSQVSSLLDSADSIRNVKNLLVGGAALSCELERKIVESGISAYIGYGMTETCSHVALRRLGDESAAYYAMPKVSFSVDDRGCLIIHSNAYSWKTLVTNDIVELIGPNAFVWRGRYDDVINSGGIKLHPVEIEKELSKVIDSPFYVVGHPSEKWGECVALVVESADDDLRLVKDVLNQMNLPRGWMPSVIVNVNELPRTSNGKIKRLSVDELNRIC